MSARLYQFYARNNRILLLLLYFIIAIFIPSTTLAAVKECPSGESMTEIGCLSKDPIQFIGDFYIIGLGLIGGVSLLFIIIGGYTILTSQGNAGQVNVGKSYIFYAIAGLVLAIFGYLFIEVLLADILHIPGFGH